MKTRSSYHVHSTHCDGKSTLEEMVCAALNQGFTHLGFSSHAPVPAKYDRDSTMAKDAFPLYRREVLALKEKYAGKIDILLGLEYDCYEDTGFAEVIPTSELDYYILSVHALDKDEHMRAIDFTTKEMDYILAHEPGGIQKVVQRYYQMLGDETLAQNPTIVGHIDLIKKNNGNNRYFNDKELWYLDTVSDCIHKIKQTDSIVEINTGGVARYGQNCLYPSNEILEMLRDSRIPLMLNSDAHLAENIAFYFEEAEQILKKAGIRSLVMLTGDGIDEVHL